MPLYEARISSFLDCLRTQEGLHEEEFSQRNTDVQLNLSQNAELAKRSKETERWEIRADIWGVYIC